MIHPAKFPPGSANRQRADLLRTLAKLSKDMATVTPFTFVRTDQIGTRSMYVVDFGDGEVGLEKSQVELLALGMVAGFASSNAPVSRARRKEILALVTRVLPKGTYPTAWLHDPQVQMAEPSPAPAEPVKKRVVKKAAT